MQKDEIINRKAAVEQFLNELKQRLNNEPTRRETEQERVEAELQQEEEGFHAEIKRAKDRIEDYRKQIEDMNKHIAQKNSALKDHPRRRERTLEQLEAEFRAEEGRLYMEIDQAQASITSLTDELNQLQ
jgi:predicted  nucleic acid-binding Zn-ribbon protein